MWLSAGVRTVGRVCDVGNSDRAMLRERTACWGRAGRMTVVRRSFAVVRMAGEQRHGAIELLEQHDAHELVGPRGGPEGEDEIGFVAQMSRYAIGSPDQEERCRPPIVPPACQVARKSDGAEIFALFVEDHPRSAGGTQLGQRDRFLGPAALGLAGAALR